MPSIRPVGEDIRCEAPLRGAEHPTFNIQHPTSNIEHRTGAARYRAWHIGRGAEGVLHHWPMLSFTKMNGAGNDFVMIDNRDAKVALTREQIAALCDRHRGIGGDGLIAVEPAQNGADFRMRYYNADGGE